MCDIFGTLADSPLNGESQKREGRLMMNRPKIPRTAGVGSRPVQMLDHAALRR